MLYDILVVDVHLYNLQAFKIAHMVNQPAAKEEDINEPCVVSVWTLVSHMQVAFGLIICPSTSERW